MPILQIDNLLRRAPFDADSKHTQIAPHTLEVNEPAIAGPFARIHKPFLRELRPFLRLEVEDFQVEFVSHRDEVPAVRRPARPLQANRSGNGRDLTAAEVENADGEISGTVGPIE